MGRRSRRKMIDTSVPEEDVEVGDSRTKARTELRQHQERLESIAVRLASLTEERRKKLDLGEALERELTAMANHRKGSALARQRRLVAKLLRAADLDALEAELANVARTLGRAHRTK